MRRIAVCDDDRGFLQQAQRLTHRFYEGEGALSEIFCYTDARGVLAAREHFDLYLLDIILPGMDGIALARKLAERDENFCVIYLTTSEEYALDAYEVDALQYLVKPVEEEAFFAALKKAEALLETAKRKEAFLSVPTPEGVVTVHLSRLCYAEYLGRVIYFHMADGAVVRSSVASMKISELEEELLTQPNFLCPHRAFLVNMDHIHVLSSTEIRMENGEIISVTRANCRETRRRYMDYLLEKKGGGKVKC